MQDHEDTTANIPWKATAENSIFDKGCVATGKITQNKASFVKKTSWHLIYAQKCFAPRILIQPLERFFFIVLNT